MNKTVLSLVLVVILSPSFVIGQTVKDKQSNDWLVNGKGYTANIQLSENGKDLVLTNGLVKRVFRTKPNLACTGYENLVNGQQLLRAVKPVAVLTIDGKIFNIGGLHGQKENAYLMPEWIDAFTANENDFQFDSYTVSEITPFISWKQTNWARKIKKGAGKALTLKFLSLIHISEPTRLGMI